MEKSNVFKIELSFIKDLRIRKSCKTIIELLPDYFFIVPASSTGKYHPDFSLGDGGLVRHVKVAVRLGFELLNDPCIGDKYNDIEKDIMIMSLILHDGLKSGLEHSKYTKFDHPILIKNFVNENKDIIDLTDDELKLFSKCVASHMGPWNTDTYSDCVLPVPKTKCENFVHMCDYLASRKFLNVYFDDNNEIKTR